MRNMKFLTAVAASLTLAGCAAGSLGTTNTSMYSVHQPVVERTNFAIDLNSDGGEIPGKREIAVLPTDKTKGSGCWDMLFQDVAGRFLQLRLTLIGDGRNSPALRAMRLWYPRFSYPQRFLPAVYREDTVSASFLDRYLASMEGMNSSALSLLRSMGL